MAATINGKAVLLSDRFLFSRNEVYSVEGPYKLSIRLGSEQGSSTFEGKNGEFELVLNGVTDGAERVLTGVGEHAGRSFRWTAVARSLTAETFAVDIFLVDA